MLVVWTSMEGIIMKTKKPILPLAEAKKKLIAAYASEAANKTFEEQQSKSFLKTRLTMIARCLLIAARQSKVGRNDPCICQSGLKFKRCCYDKVQEARDRNPNL